MTFKLHRFRSAILLALATILNGVPSWAEPTIADYGNLPATQMLSISSSGKTIAFRKTSGGVDQLAIVSLEKNEVLRKTDVAAVLPRQMYFIGDNHIILVASKLIRLSGYRGEHDVSTAFALNIDTGEAVQLLTPGDNIHMGQTGLGRIVGVSGDKQNLYMPAYVSKHTGDQDPDFHLMKVKIKSPRRPSIFRKGSSETVDWFTSADGGVLAREDYNNRTNVHRVLADRDGNWVSIFEDEAEVMNVSFVGVTPDESALVMLEENPTTGRTSYASMSLKDGSITRNLFSRPDADVEYVIKDINRVAHGVIYSGFSPTYSFFDAELEKRVQEIQALFPEHSVWLRDWSGDWKHLVVYVEGPLAPGDYYLFTAGQPPRFLTSARPNIEEQDVNPIAIITIKARDGLEIPTILTVPRDKADSPKKLPAIMLPHGGPESYDRVEFDWLAQAFASQGYLVIQPQFRGSAGFGADHLAAGYGEWGRKMQDDLIDSLNYLVRGNIVDESRVCTVGASYGGYAALAAGAFTPELYRCVVSLNGVSDLPGMLAFERGRYGRKHWVVSYFENFMVKGEATKDKLNAISPVNFGEQFIAPVLLIHGENDETVPYKQSDDMHDRLRSANKEVQLIKLKDENHNLMSGENRLEALEAMIAFVNRYIGD